MIYNLLINSQQYSMAVQLCTIRLLQQYFLLNGNSDESSYDDFKQPAINTLTVVETSTTDKLS